MKYLLMGALLTWSSAAHGEDEKPKFSNIKQGETAPFDGRLFNDAAVSKIIVDMLNLKQTINVSPMLLIFEMNILKV